MPVLLSVGYAACHWCHVMAHESFEDHATAALVNDSVVAIKVDREERPDIDAVYMEAVQAMTGSVLLIGGSGPTGPLIAAGLTRLGHKVTILHRGVHEVAETDGLEHIHADPHFAGPLRDAIAARTFDVVVAT